MVAITPFILTAGSLIGLSQASRCRSRPAVKPPVTEHAVTSVAQQAASTVAAATERTYSTTVVTTITTGWAKATEAAADSEASSAVVVSVVSSAAPEKPTTVEKANAEKTTVEKVTSAEKAKATSAPAASAAPSAQAIVAGDVRYKNYRGDGSVGQGWPDISQWISFDTMFNNMRKTSAGGCDWMGVGANSDQEDSDLKAAILEAGEQSGLDPRFILAVIYNESSGCVRMYTTWGKYRNPGLMQCFEGKHTCNDPEAGVSMKKPCPADTIKAMIFEGVGITADKGLKYTVKESAASDVSKYYKGGVIYNSGGMPEDGNLGASTGNKCYASDVANRVMGWVADQSPCNRDTIKNLDGPDYN